MNTALFEDRGRTEGWPTRCLSRLETETRVFVFSTLAWCLTIFWFSGLVLEAEIVGIQELVRFSFPFLELVHSGQTDRSEYRANTFHVGMLAPNGLRESLDQNFPQ